MGRWGGGRGGGGAAVDFAITGLIVECAIHYITTAPLLQAYHTENSNGYRANSVYLRCLQIQLLFLSLFFFFFFLREGGGGI